MVRKEKRFTFALPIRKMVAEKVLKSGVDKGFEESDKSKEAEKNFKKLLVERKKILPLQPQSKSD
ncbi:MAG TPA: hypothetical protein VFL76_03435 [Edaphocola sp.]|nr:hypothetical protein [Edaphocola sp.]